MALFRNKNTVTFPYSSLSKIDPGYTQAYNIEYVHDIIFN
jgi:hypothetical protein